MVINTTDWKLFRIDEVFTVQGGYYNKKPEHSIDGDIPFLAATDSNNGATEYYSIQDISEWDKVGNPDNKLFGKLFPFPSIAVTVNGSVCNAYYQNKQFTCSHDISVLTPKDGHTLSVMEGLFCCTIIQQEKYRWSYGRKPHDVNKLSALEIKLPQTSEGLPNWAVMEMIMNTLQCKPLTTSRTSTNVSLNTKKWKTFTLNDLFDIQMGNGFDKNKMTNDEPTINFVSRISFDNGVDWVVDRLDDTEPFEAGLITVALGGSYLGHAFIQREPFYTAQNVAVMKPKNDQMSFEVKLFISSLIRREAGYKYQAFGRELNSHINRDFTINLPVDSEGKPDWDWMENYIKSLPMAEHLPN